MAGARGAGGPETARGDGRVGVFDVVRGFSVVSMVGFHLCYDLAYLAGASLPWFSGALMYAWRCSISWAFLFVAGCMCTLSRSNWRRGGVYALFAALIFLVTWVAGVDVPISFGIIFCMAASTLLYAVLERLGAAPRGYAAAAVLVVLFLLSLNVPWGTFGIGPISVGLPRGPYDTGALAWLGFPSASFSSGDYYPMLPYTLLYLAGASCAAVWTRRGYPAWAREAHVAPLTWAGRHALLVYVIHQPLLLLACGLV